MRLIVRYFLKLFTARILKKYNPDVVGITGSVGKTSVKDITLKILSKKFRVSGSPDSYNTFFGVLLTVVGEKSPGRSFITWFYILGKALFLCIKKKKSYAEILVLEMAANRPGDIKELTELIQCNVGVVTAISPVHIKFFKTIKKLFREKQLLVRSLDRTGFAILNRDDLELYSMRKKTDADVITYGFHPDSTVRASDINIKKDPQTGWPEGVFFKVIYQGSVVPIYLPGVVGEHVIYSALAAISIAIVFGLNLVEISRALQELKMPPGRMRVLPGIKNTLIIDDSYNASPISVKAALNTFSKLDLSNAKRYIILGDMLELGQQTEKYHREMGIRVAELNFDYLITVGSATKNLAKAAINKGVSEDKVASFSDTKKAGLFLQEKLKPGDACLIKGSRAMKMEKVVKEVLAKPLKESELLVH
ncbi:MAG: hypothetical protein GF349_02125 [Candidatus Magasanikbacteria bacterium]|nr:hypothetical protein [Candidatus Magasanikbacteria bacterium]